jgi:spore germination cell wall hydrolase CwlJ-like protein
MKDGVLIALLCLCIGATGILDGMTREELLKADANIAEIESMLEELATYPINIVKAHPDTQPETTQAETAAPGSGGGQYEGIVLTDSEIKTLAALVYLEARGEPYEGQKAVAECVFNRMLSGSFPGTLDGVIYQKGQFSPAGQIKDSMPTETQYNAVYDALSGDSSVLDTDVVYFSGKPQNNRVFAVIGNHYFCRE